MDFGSQINSIINNICRQLGTTVENVVPELAKYKAICALGGCAVGGLIFLGTLILTIIIYIYGKKTDEEGWIISSIFCGCTGLGVAIIVWSVCIYNYIVWSQAPTGATVDWLIHQIK